MDRIDVRRLGTDVSSFGWTERPQELGLEAEPAFRFPVTIEIGARRVGTRVLVTGTCRSRVRLECSRCLEAFEQDLAAEVAVEFREGPSPHRHVDEIRDEDVDVSYYTHPFVDLADDLRQILLVATPAYPVCRESCRGLCARCGANLNTAPCGHEPEGPRRPFEGLASLTEKER